MTTDGYNTMDNASIMMVRSVQARYEQQKALADKRLELLRDANAWVNSHEETRIIHKVQFEKFKSELAKEIK